MKVYAFDGSACSGKTTTIREVSKVLKHNGYSVSVIDESFRDILKECEKSLDEVREDYDIFTLMEEEAIKRRIAMWSNIPDVDIILVDRLLVSYLLYTIEYLPVRKWIDIVTKYGEVVIAELLLVNKIFLCKPIPMIDVCNDRQRSFEDIKRQWRHYSLLAKWLDNENVIILSGTVNERVNTVVNEILSDVNSDKNGD